MSKHTKGPWSYSVYEDSNHCKIYLHGLGRADKIAGADSLQGYCGEANARLIAASPDLLEALEGLLKRIDDDAEAKDWWSDSKNLARQAIAKVKGK